MAIKIGEDGTIINDNEITSTTGTIIREDGTIESSNVGRIDSTQRRNISLTAPVSPLENNETVTPDDQSEVQTQYHSEESLSFVNERKNAKSIADLEYDLMIAEGHVRGAMSKTPIIIGLISLLLGIFIHPICFIGIIVACGMFYSENTKKVTHEAEAKKIRDEISRLKQQ